jgi:hypothetical protein
MRKRKYPGDVLEQTQEVIQAWNQISTTQVFGTLTVASLTSDLTAVNTMVTDVCKLETQLNDKRNQRDAALAALWDKLKRTRANFKGTYGDDSYQYNLVGGTRISERKTRTRKTIAQA